MMTFLSLNRFLQILAFIAWAIGTVWLFVDPGFESILTFVTGLAAFLGALAVKEDTTKGNEQGTVLEITHRRRLLTRVRESWIKGVLEQSLQGAAHIRLNMRYDSANIERPWSFVRKGGPVTIPPNTLIEELFDQAAGLFLILGEPGAGKTTTLLELCEDLIVRAEKDPQSPLPIVFKLATWTPRSKSIADWMVAELSDIKKYGVSKPLAKRWVTEQHILPLLDGLDEIAPQHYEACVAAINEFYSQNPQNMAVTCRAADYQALKTPLNVAETIILQPLTLTQADNYLSSGEGLEAARLALRADALLQELAQSPLNLSVIALAYQNQQVETLKAGTLAERRSRLYDTYIRQMFSHRTTQVRYSLQEFVSRLHYLANIMTETTFYAEDLQPSMLLNLSQKVAYVVLTLVAFVMTFVIVASSVSSIGSLLDGVITQWETLVFNIRHYRQALEMNINLIGTYIVISTLFNSTIGLLLGGVYSATQLIPLQGSHILNKIIRVLIEVFAVGLSWGIAFGIMQDISTGVFIGLLFSLITGVVCLQQNTSSLSKITVANSLSWNLRSSLIGVGFGGVCFFLLASCLFLVDGLVYTENITFNINPYLISSRAGVFLISTFLLFGGLFGGLISPAERVTTIYWNKGIKNSMRSAILGVTMYAIAFLLFVYTTSLVVSQSLNIGLVLAFLIFFNAFFTMVGLAYGGKAVLQHIALRLVMKYSGLLPFRLSPFFQQSKDLLFLRQVGFGYIFIHPLIRKHFAELDPTRFRDQASG